MTLGRMFHPSGNRLGVLAKPIWWLADHGDSIFVLMMYVLVTAFFTWPLVANFTGWVNGNVLDVYHELWYLNYDWHAPYGPFFNLWTTSIFYPYGVPLYYQVLSPLHAIIGWPVYLVFGLVPAYNFLYMFTFFIGAFSMYILAKYLTGNRLAAFIAGLAYGFAPVHAGQAIAHLNIMGSELLPIFVYFFIKMAREPNERNGIYAGIFIVLNAMIDLHFLLLSGMIIVTYLIYSFFAQRKVILNKGYVIRFVLMLGVAGIFGLVAYYQTFYGLVFAPANLGAATAATLAVHLHRSPDLYQFVLPPPMNPFFGQLSAPYLAKILSFSQVQTYFGYTVLALAVLGGLANRGKREVYFWAFLAVVGFFISLGPAIEMGGKVTQLQGVWTYLYYLVPLFRSFRTPYRIDYLVAFGLAVLAGYGAAALLSRVRRGIPSSPRMGRVLAILLTAIISVSVVAEFSMAPYPMLNAGIPTFYTQVLANDHSNYTVLEVPAYVGNNNYQYYQSAYDAPQLNGQVSRTPPTSALLLQSYPFLENLGRYLGVGGAPKDIINETINPAVFAPYVLAEYHVKYIILHKDMLPPNIYQRAYSRISTAIGLPYYQDNLLTVFKFDPPSTDFGLAMYPKIQNTSLMMLLYGGWAAYGLIGAHARAMDIDAGLYTYSSTSQYVQFSFKAEGITGTHLIQLTVNGQVVGTYYMTQQSYTVFTTPYVWLHSGLNVVEFTSLEGCSSVTVGKTGLVSSATGGTTLAPPSVACASVQFKSIAAQPMTVASR